MAARKGVGSRPRRPRLTPLHTLYTVWAFTADLPDRPLLLGITPDAEIAVAIRRLAGGGPVTGGTWARVTIDVRHADPLGMRAWVDLNGGPQAGEPLSDAQLLDLIQDKRRLSDYYDLKARFEPEEEEELDEVALEAATRPVYGADNTRP
jgi:hypothetical protein